MRNISVKAAVTTGLLLVLLATLSMMACDSPRETTSSTTSITPTSLSPPGSTTVRLARESPISKDFNLSQAPNLGETAELTLEITKINQLWEPYQPREGLAHSKAWVDFYWTNIHGSLYRSLNSRQDPP